MVCGPRGSKSRLAIAAGAEPAGQMRDKKLHAVVARSTFASKKLKAPHVRSFNFAAEITLKSLGILFSLSCKP